MLGHQERFKICGYQVPQYFWFVISGALCDIVQALIDYMVYQIYVFDWERATVCWTVSYTLSIIVRHSSHRLIVFGEFEGSYCSSLGRTYLTYSTSIILSMVSNHFIINAFMLSHRDAWIITMLWTVGYAFLPFLLLTSLFRAS